MCPSKMYLWRIQGEGAQLQARAPLKLDQLSFFYPIFYIRMLKNKAQMQIARESIKTTLDLPGPLKAAASLGPLSIKALLSFGVCCVEGSLK